MSKFLVVDPLSPKGHVIYNYGIIEAVLMNNDCDIILSKYIASKLKENGINAKKIKEYPNFFTLDYIAKKIKIKIIYHILFRLCYLLIVLKTFLLSKQYDCVLFTSIDVFSFFFLSFFANEKFYVVDHSIGKIKSSRLYRFLWKNINKDINIIVMESYIKEMVDDVLPQRNVYILKHPLPKQKKDLAKRQDGFIKLFAPSYSNEQKYVDEILKYKWPYNIQITIKGIENKTIGNVREYSNYISDEEYANLFSHADYILIPYGDDYNYKTSAVLHEAAVMNKNVFVFSNNTLKQYANVYKHKVVTVDSIQQILDILNHKERFFSPEPYDLHENSCEEISKIINSFVKQQKVS